MISWFHWISSHNNLNQSVEDAEFLTIFYVTESCTSLKLIHILLDLQRYIGNIQVKVIYPLKVRVINPEKVKDMAPWC